jgi:ketosteroid isomerase-like protein
MAKNDAIVERLLAYEEIGQLAARYAVATDSRDLDALVALFVPDVQVGENHTGRAALRAYFAQSLRDVGVTILNVGTHVIEFDDADHARGVVYCRGELQVGDRWVVQAVQYRDLYERREGHWYFVRRRQLHWYGRVVGSNPLGLPPTNWPAQHSGWGELPDAWPTWSAFWGPDAPEH